MSILLIFASIRLVASDFPASCTWDFAVKKEVECDVAAPNFVSIPTSLSSVDASAAAAEIRHLQVQNQPGLASVPPYAFAAILPKLYSVQILNSGLQDLEAFAFAGLSRLRQVKIQGNEQLRRLPWLSFATSILGRRGYRLDLGSSLPNCSCELHWMRAAPGLSTAKPQHSIVIPGQMPPSPGEDYQYLDWDLYGLPHSFAFPDRCLDGAHSLPSADFLDGSCRDEVAAARMLQLRLSFTAGGQAAPLGIFESVDEKRITCRLSQADGADLRGPVILEIRVWQVQVAVDKERYKDDLVELDVVTVERNASSLTVSLAPGPPALGYVTCRLAKSHPQVLEPIADIRPLLTHSAPRIHVTWPMFVPDAGPNYCHYVATAYPLPSVTWFTKDGDIVLDEKLKFAFHNNVGDYKADKPHIFYLFSGDIVVHVYKSTRGNYTLRLCNDYGCDFASCNLNWSMGNPWLSKAPDPPFRSTDVSGPLSFPLVFLLAVGGITVVVLATLALFCLRHRGASKHMLLDSSNGGRNSDLWHELRPMAPEPTRSIPCSLGENNSLYDADFSFLRYLSLPPALFHAPDAVKLRDDIGEGCFSNVYVATLRRPPTADKADEDWDAAIFPDGVAERNVAVKCPKCNSSQMREGLTHEIRCLSLLRHRNIVQFLGLSLQDSGAVWLLFEYLPKGNLRQLLLESAAKEPAPGQEPLLVQERSLSCRDMLDMGEQVAEGLAFLAEHHVVHRDLAARNCLVGDAADGARLIKLSDFGMSRDIYYAEYYKVTGQKCMPIRWMCPEALVRGIFTHAGDVWSLGIVLWEVWTLGKQPWFGFSNVEVIAKVSNGETLHAPKDQPKPIKDLMDKCWDYNPEERPKASEVRSELALLQARLADASLYEFTTQ